MKRQIGAVVIAIVVLVVGGACGLESEPLPHFSVLEIENPDLQPKKNIRGELIGRYYGDYMAWGFEDRENGIYVEVLRPIVGGYDFSYQGNDVFTPLELPTSSRGVVGEISKGENYGLAATIGVPDSYDVNPSGYYALWETVRSDFLLHKHFRLDAQFDGDDPETGNFIERLNEEANNIIAIARMSMELEAAESE